MGYLLASPPLPAGLRRAIDQAADVWLSPVSIWEAGLLVRGGRIRLSGVPFRPWCEQLQMRLPAREAPLTREVALTAIEVKLPHRDPADHLLAATALVFDLTLATLDRRLITARWLRTRSR